MDTVRTLTLTLLAAALCFWPAGARAQDAQHPRLLLTADQIPALRARVAGAPYTEMVKAIEATVAAEPATDDVYNTSFYARNLSTLYLATGNPQYADRARSAILALANNPIFIDPKYKGLTRACMAMNVAATYDLCYAAWDAETRALISAKLRQCGDALIASGGAGMPSGGARGNNWWAVRYSGAGLALLACDEPGTADNITAAYRMVVRYFRDNLGTVKGVNGWNGESIGYAIYPWTFIGPFAVAMQQVQGKDLLAEYKPAQKALWAISVGAVPIARPGGRGLHADFADDNPGWNAQGTAALALALSPAELQPGLLWQYDHLCGAAGDRTYDATWAGGIYSLLFYPQTQKPQNPANVWGLTYIDPAFGMAMFRNRYQDDQDIVAQITAKGRVVGHNGPDLNGFRILGLGTCWTTGSGRIGNPQGQDTVFPADPNTITRGTAEIGKLASYLTRPDGSGYAIVTGSSTGVANMARRFIADYSGMSGADGLFIVADSSYNGRFWRLNTPEFNTVTVGKGEFTITSPDGHHLYGKVLYPAGAAVRTGAFPRDNPNDPHSGGYGYRDKVYHNNTWVDFESPDGQFLVALSVVPQGKPAPQISATGTGINQTITAGRQTITINGTAITVPGWEAKE